MKIIELYRRTDDLWDWRLIETQNGQIVATSGGQGYTERNDASEMAFELFEGIYPIQDALDT